MLDDVGRALAGYATVVFSFRDDDGFPSSVRCVPGLDRARGGFRLGVGRLPDVVPWPASLLAHEHDAQLWNQRSVLVRGRIERRDGEAVFVPTRIVPGIERGIVPFVRFVIRSRQATNEYLRSRGLSRPTIPWDRIVAIRERALGGR